MSFTDVFATPDDRAGGYLRSSEVQTPIDESLGAQFGESFMSGVRDQLVRPSQFAAAGVVPSNIGEASLDEPFNPTDVPLTPIAEAKARVKQEGLEGQVNLPDQDNIAKPVLDLMIQHGHERADYNAAVERGPHGFVPGALGWATQIGAGMIDPINAGAFAIPVFGEVAPAAMLLGAGEGMLPRLAARAVVGAAQGTVGGAALVPADWWLHTQDGQDYTFADALRSVVLSAGMGVGFHAGLGAIGDVMARARGRPLSGSIEDLRARALAGDTHAADIVEKLGSAGVHLPEEALEPGGVDTDEVPGISAPAQVGGEPQLKTGLPPHPAEVLADLPPGAREDVTRAAIADVIKGEPVQAGELLQEAGKADPRIAESIEAWHGSPHDFEAFDSGKIGVGEGAQVYGHGLYFAENEQVGSSYRTAGTDLSDAEHVAMHALQVSDGDTDRALQYLADAPQSLAEQYDIGTLEGAQKLLKNGWDGNRGNLYKVHLRANKEHFLDYEKPLSDQSDHVRGVVEKLQDEFRARDENTSFGTAEPVETGATLYERLASDIRPLRPLYPSKWHAVQTASGPGQFANTWRVTDPDGVVHSVAGVRSEQEAIRQAYELAPGWGNSRRDAPGASRLLAERGISGIKYRDQGSRAYEEELAALKAQINNPPAPREGSAVVYDKAAWNKQIQGKIDALAGGPTHNYVVFDDKLIRITHKNGKEVGLNELKAGQGGEPGLPKIDNSHDVVSGANSAKDPNGPVYVDRRIPEFSPTLKDRDGNPANLHKYLAIHERTEAKAEAGGMPYLKAHTDVATPAERAAVEADGVSWKGYTDEIDGYLSKIEHEKAVNPPTEPLHVDPEAAIGHHHSDNKQSAGAGPALPVEAEKPAQPPTAREDARSPPLAGELEGGRAAGDNVVPLRQRPDWQKLRDRAPSVDDQDFAAASREAEKSPEVASTEPAKAVSAAQAEAAKADKLLADILPTLSDDERKTFEDALADLQHDTETREQIVRDGAACLAAAAA